MTNRLSTSILLIALAAPGCGAVDTEPAGHTVRDSAGIRVVESTVAAWTSETAWRVEPEPELEIGMIDGPAAYLFSAIWRVLALSDGTIVVADAGSNEVRWFGPAGEHIATAGGEGAGPGEFARLFGIWRFPGDSVAAYGANLMKVEVFDSRGRYARGIGLTHALKMDPTRFDYRADFHHMAGSTARGDLIVMTAPGMSRDVAPGPAFVSRTLLRFDRDGEGPDTMFVANIQRTEVTATSPRMQSASRLFASSVTPIATEHGVFTADPDSFEVRRYDAVGQLVGIFRLSHEPVRVLPEHLSAERARRIEAAPPVMRPASRRRSSRTRYRNASRSPAGCSSTMMATSGSRATTSRTRSSRRGTCSPPKADTSAS